MKFTAIILAGGKSRRMGVNKAFLPFHDKPLIQYSIDLAKFFTDEIWISANNRDFDYLGFPVVSDVLPVNAPLAGIHAGLRASKSDWNLVLTCDMPNVTKGVIEKLRSVLDDNLRMIVPVHDGYVEPLCGFYHRSLIPVMDGNMKAGKLSLLDLSGSAPHRFVEMTDFSSEEIALLFRNMNEKRDLLD
jgi:molybdopterin-guanine dinucleotide biosynthesis protein A